MRRERWFLVGLLLLLLVACTDTGNIPDDGETPPPSGSFTVSTDGVSNVLQPGGRVFVPIFIERTGGFDGAVSLELFGAPEGITGTFDPQDVRGNESELTIITDGSVAPGSYSLSVRGTSRGLSDTTQIPLTVIGSDDQPGFSLALSPSSLRIAQGESDSVNITINTSGGFNNEISLSLSNVPNGVEASFATNPATNSSRLTLLVNSSAEPDSYEIIVRGESGSLSSSTQLSLVIPGNVSGNASISGSVHTDNFLGNFMVPSSLEGQSLTVQGDRPDYVPGQLLVQFKNTGLTTTANGTESYESLSQALRADYEFRVLEAGSFNEPALIAIPAGQSVEEAAARLSADPRIAYAEPNYYIYLQSIPNEPAIRKEWNMPVSGLPVAWSARNSANSVTVAVLDTGIDISHPELQTAIVSGGYDFCASDDCNTTDSTVAPEDAAIQHGTHVTGVLAAAGNGQGIVGVLYGGANIVPIKVFYGGTTTADALSEAIRYAAGETVNGQSNPNPADIINLSVGTTSDSATLRNAVEAAQDRGVLIIAAAGNNGLEGVYAPARYNDVIAVGSVNRDFERSCFSAYGPELDLMAAGGEGPALGKPSANCSPPIQGIFSTFTNNDYGIEAGTSQAVPLVSGVAALVWAEHPGWDANEVAQHLKTTAEDLGSDNQYGAGLVRADVALGFPGPGDQATVTTSGGLDTVELNLQGGSSSYVIDGLSAGTYTLRAEALGEEHSLSGSREASLSAGQTRTGVEIEVD